MGVVLCGQGDVESLCLLGFVMTDNHMVRVVFRVPVTNLLPAACSREFREVQFGAE